MRFGNVPTPEQMPEIGDLLDAYTTAQDAHRKAQGELAKLVSPAPGSRTSQLDADAKAADKALLAAASRDGKPTDKVGTPNQDRLAKKRDAARRDVEAAKAALVEATTALVDGIHANGDTLLADTEARVDEASGRYVDVIGLLADTRTSFAEAIGLRSFVERALASRPDLSDVVSLVVQLDDVIPGEGPHGSRPSAALAAMEKEAKAKGRKGPKPTHGGGRFHDEWGRSI